MTHDEAVEELKEIREYFPRSFKGHKALDYAIAQLERKDTVTQFDERIASLRDSSKKDCLWEGYALALLADMHAHIVQLEGKK